MSSLISTQKRGTRASPSGRRGGWIRACINWSFLLFFVGSTALFMDFVALQIVQAIARRDTVHSDAPQTRRRHPIYHHDLAPNAAAPDSRWGTEKYSFFTNSLAFRDFEVREVPLQANRTRVLFIGDSFTEGLGVDYEDTFTGRISKNLNAEVLNAGVSSYSPVIYLAKVRHLIEDVGLKFDHLVVYLDLSDIQDEVLYQMNSKGQVERLEKVAQLEDKREEATKPMPQFFGLKHLIRENTYLLPMAYQAFRRMTLGIEAQHSFKKRRAYWTLDPQLQEDFAREGLQRASMHMNELYSLLKKHNIEMSLAVYPWPTQVYYGDHDSLQERHWQAWANRHQVQLISHFKDFVIAGATRDEQIDVIQKYFILGDAHWNSEGHKKIAEGFLEQFKKYRSTPSVQRVGQTRVQ